MAILEYLSSFDADRFNFIRCNGQFIAQDYVCLEFELLDMNLLDFLNRKPSHCFSVKEIRPILQQVCVTFVCKLWILAANKHG